MQKQPSPWPIVRIQEPPEIPAEILPQILREINDRQWGAILQILIEAKFKAESQLRNDAIFSEPGRVAFYTGWLAYSDYIIGCLDGLRQEPSAALEQRQPGPEDF